MTKPTLSIAVPFYNEEKNISEFFRRTLAVLEKINLPAEVIAVDDGSTDGTYEELEKIRTRFKNLKIITLSRNFGHEAAVTAALDCTSGQKVVLMDGDLQDEPEFIPSLLEKLDKEGFDVAFAKHDKRSDPAARKFLFKFFYKVMNRLSSHKLPLEAGAFSAMTRPVVEELSKMTEQNRYVAGLRSWVGFKQIGVPYEKKARFAGKPPQTFSKLVKMGLDALFSFSYVPLRLATLLGLIVAFLAFLVIVNALLQKLVFGTAILGWASPLVSTLFLGAVQLIILGIIGEYLARIYDEVKRRPYYVVKGKIGF